MTTSRAATTPVSPSWGRWSTRVLIIKSGGNGTSLLTGTYSQPSPGAVTVDSGTLLLPSGSPTPATVAAGGGYGSGRCLAPAQPGCLAQTFGLDRQNAQFQVPTEDSYRRLGRDPGALHHVVGSSTSASRSRRTPPACQPLQRLPRSCRFAMTNGSWTGEAGPRSTSSDARSDGAPYVALQPCLPDGAPPLGQVACVDRRGLAGSSRNVVDAEGSGNAPDVIMVVRTVDTSRWVAR